MFIKDVGLSNQTPFSIVSKCMDWLALKLTGSKVSSLYAEITQLEKEVALAKAAVASEEVVNAFYANRIHNLQYGTIAGLEWDLMIQEEKIQACECELHDARFELNDLKRRIILARTPTRALIKLAKARASAEKVKVPIRSRREAVSFLWNGIVALKWRGRNASIPKARQ